MIESRVEYVRFSEKIAPKIGRNGGYLLREAVEQKTPGLCMTLRVFSNDRST